MEDSGIIRDQFVTDSLKQVSLDWGSIEPGLTEEEMLYGKFSVFTQTEEHFHEDDLSKSALGSIEEKEKEIAKLKKELTDYDIYHRETTTAYFEENEELQEQNEELQERISELVNLIKKKDLIITEFHNYIEEKDKITITEINNYNEEKDKITKIAQEELLELINTMEKSLKEKDLLIQGNETLLQTINEKVAQKEALITSLREEQEEKEILINSLRTELEDIKKFSRGAIIEELKEEKRCDDSNYFNLCKKYESKLVEFKMKINKKESTFNTKISELLYDTVDMNALLREKEKSIKENELLIQTLTVELDEAKEMIIYLLAKEQADDENYRKVMHRIQKLTFNNQQEVLHRLYRLNEEVKSKELIISKKEEIINSLSKKLEHSEEEYSEFQKSHLKTEQLHIESNQELQHRLEDLTEKLEINESIIKKKEEEIQLLTTQLLHSVELNASQDCELNNFKRNKEKCKTEIQCQNNELEKLKLSQGFIDGKNGRSESLNSKDMTGREIIFQSMDIHSAYNEENKKGQKDSELNSLNREMDILENEITSLTAELNEITSSPGLKENKFYNLCKEYESEFLDSKMYINYKEKLYNKLKCEILANNNGLKDLITHKEFIMKKNENFIRTLTSELEEAKDLMSHLSRDLIEHGDVKMNLGNDSLEEKIESMMHEDLKKVITNWKSMGDNQELVNSLEREKEIKEDLENSSHILTKNEDLKYKDLIIKEREELIQSLTIQLANEQSKNEQRQVEVQELSGALEMIQVKESLIKEKEDIIISLTRQIENLQDTNKLINSKDLQLKEKENLIQKLSEELEEIKNELIELSDDRTNYDVVKETKSEMKKRKSNIKKKKKGKGTEVPNFSLHCQREDQRESIHNEKLNKENSWNETRDEVFDNMVKDVHLLETQIKENELVINSLRSQLEEQNSSPMSTDYSNCSQCNKYKSEIENFERYIRDKENMFFKHQWESQDIINKLKEWLKTGKDLLTTKGKELREREDLISEQKKIIQSLTLEFEEAKRLLHHVFSN